MTSALGWEMGVPKSTDKLRECNSTPQGGGQEIKKKFGRQLSMAPCRKYEQEGRTMNYAQLRSVGRSPLLNSVFGR